MYSVPELLSDVLSEQCHVVGEIEVRGGEDDRVTQNSFPCKRIYMHTK